MHTSIIVPHNTSDGMSHAYNVCTHLLYSSKLSFDPIACNAVGTESKIER